MARSIIERAGFNGPCVLNTGAVIYDAMNKKILQEYTLDSSLIPTAYSIMKKYHVKVLINDTRKEYLFDGRKIPERAYNLFTYGMKPRNADDLAKKLESISGIAVHKIPAWEKGFVCVEATHPQSSKLHGIVTISKILNVDTHEIIGVGDGYNDFPLLMACGLKIAMGNAVPELKAIADFIAPTVEEEGVAVVIVKFLLNN
jgi:hydroxymethylpyrimidine pyrophosphatase-like HAD family hydrolase